MLTNIATERRLLRGLRFLHSILIWLFVLILVIVALNLFVISRVRVQDQGMISTIQQNQSVWIDQGLQRFQDPRVGEVVLAQLEDNPAIQFVRRVYAVPGTEMEWNGQKLTLGADEYWLVGDNREHSPDSRTLGPIKRKNIVGKVLGRPGQIIAPAPL